MVGAARAWAVVGQWCAAVAAGLVSVGLVGVIVGVALVAISRVYNAAAIDVLAVGVFGIDLALAVRLYGAMLQLHARTLPSTRSRAVRILGSVCFVVSITVADVILLWGMVLVALVFLL